MTLFDSAISDWMSSPVTTVSVDTTLPEVDRILVERGVSCAPVVDANGRAVGVISRTDLLRLGRVLARDFGSPATLELPARRAGDEMHVNIVTVDPREPLTFAARRMVNGGFHRVFASDGDHIVGVVGTQNILAALAQSRLGLPIGAVMTSPAICIHAQLPLSEAVDLLQKERVSGLVVIDDTGWPAGIFSQVEALATRALSSNTAVALAMSFKLLNLYEKTQLHYAAAQAHATGARRILVFDPLATQPGRPKLKGIVTGVDFARAVV